jgi:hypothetical protein
MATFVIKNLGVGPVTVLGSTIAINGRLDLLTIATGTQIVASMRNGELYELLMGRTIAVADIPSFHNIGATQDDLDFFAYCGFMQGHLGSDDLKYPFHFTSDGYVLAETVGCYLSASIDGYVLPDDNTFYSPPLRLLIPITAGNLCVMLENDVTNTFIVPVTAGEKITYLMVKKIMKTNTTVTGGIYAAR